MPETLGNVDWTAIAGILGTLSGVLIGSLVTYKIQARRLQYEDKTRFHSLRMEIYAQLIKSANNSVAGFLAGKVIFEEVDSFHDHYGQLQLVASKRVILPARNLHSAFNNLQKKMLDSIKLSEDDQRRFSEAISEFVKEIRKELHS